MDQLLESAQDAFEGQIDFEGQRLTELLTTLLLAISGVVAFALGYISQDVHLSLYTALAGSALTFIVVVPSWPFYNRNPVNWIGSPGGAARLGIQVDGKRVG